MQVLYTLQMRLDVKLLLLNDEIIKWSVRMLEYPLLDKLNVKRKLAMLRSLSNLNFLLVSAYFRVQDSPFLALPFKV